MRYELKRALESLGNGRKYLKSNPTATSRVVNLKLDKVKWAGSVRSRLLKRLGRAVLKIYNPGDESVRFGSLSSGFKLFKRTSNIFISKKPHYLWRKCQKNIFNP